MIHVPTLSEHGSLLPRDWWRMMTYDVWYLLFVNGIRYSHVTLDVWYLLYLNTVHCYHVIDDLWRMIPTLSEHGSLLPRDWWRMMTYDVWYLLYLNTVHCSHLAHDSLLWIAARVKCSNLHHHKKSIIILGIFLRNLYCGQAPPTDGHVFAGDWQD